MSTTMNFSTNTNLDRKMPAIIVRFVFDSYSRQAMIVQWDGYRSKAFGVSNGVNQVGVLSPLLFAM